MQDPQLQKLAQQQFGANNVQASNSLLSLLQGQAMRAGEGAMKSAQPLGPGTEQGYGIPNHSTAIQQQQHHNLLEGLRLGTAPPPQVRGILISSIMEARHSASLQCSISQHHAHHITALVASQVVMQIDWSVEGFAACN